MRHEEYRQALQREYERKQKIEEDKRLSDQALADLDELDKELAKYWVNQTSPPPLPTPLPLRNGRHARENTRD